MSRYSVTISNHRGGELAPIIRELHAQSLCAVTAIVHAAYIGAGLTTFEHSRFMERVMKRGATSVTTYASTPSGGRIVAVASKTSGRS